MITKVRTHPITVFLCTMEDAAEVREVSGTPGSGSCFATESFGYDGWCWKTAESFEEDWNAGPGSVDPLPLKNGEQ